MPQEKLSMRRLREVLRLKFTSQLSNRAIARACNISPGTVSYYTRAAKGAELDLSSIDKLSDDLLIEKLTPHCTQLRSSQGKKKLPDYNNIYLELKKKGVTLQLLHEEYISAYGTVNTYSYSMFCESYRAWLKTQKPSLRINHKSGEKVFVDYAGPTIDIHDPSTGDAKKAKVFIGVMGASNYTYAEATLTRSSSDWLSSHVRMLNFFGGVPELIIPDNEKAAVKDACYYDPELNPNYAAFAEHYDVVILPARPYKPKDKAKVENAVQVVERWILARLRNYKFFSLSELNEKISELLVVLNNKPFKKLPGSRLSQFEKLDKPELTPLPNIDFAHFDFKQYTVRNDYHVEIDSCYYSVPSTLIGEVVDCHITPRIVEIYYKNKRIASHVYSTDVGKAKTLDEHMPASHKHHKNWTPDVFKSWAKNIGDSAYLICEKTISLQKHPECCYKIYLGFTKLSKLYGNELLEKAFEYALSNIDSPTFSSIKSILQNKLYLQDVNIIKSVNDQEYLANSYEHENVRGNRYYQTNQTETME